MKSYLKPTIEMDNLESGVVMTSLETGEDTGIQMSGELDLDALLQE